jgi:hypothetical protein
MVASLRKSLWDTSIQIQLTDTSAARHKLDMSRVPVKYKYIYILETIVDRREATNKYFCTEPSLEDRTCMRYSGPSYGLIGGIYLN